MKYVVHNLVQIDVADEVMGTIGSSLEFQIGYFKLLENKEELEANVLITIQPYCLFEEKIQSMGDISEFHLSKGIKGVCTFNEVKRLAVMRTKAGYSIYADGPNFLINLYIQLTLYEAGYTMVHAGAYSDQHGVTLLAGPGGVGKTALLGYMVTRFNRQILGDDIIIVRNSGQCFSFPRAFVFKEYHREVYPELFKELKIRKWSTYGIKRFIIDNMPFTGVIKNGLRKIGKYYAVAVGLGMDPCLATVPVEKIFGDAVILDQGNIHRIIFLERYNGDVVSCEPMDEASMSKRLFSIIHHEWKDVLDELFIMGSMEVVDLADYFGKVEETINEFVRGKELKFMQIPNGTSPTDLVQHFERLGLS